MSRRRLRGEEVSPEVVDFHRTKYGRELLVDAGYVSRYANFARAGRPHRLAFHDVLLVTRGAGSYRLDGRRHVVTPGVVLFTRPGEVREWRVRGAVDGACVFFTAGFVADAFADPRFLDQFAYFRADRPSCALRLTAAQQRQYLRRFGAMRREIATLRDDASDALRAVLYDLLVLLNRYYAGRHGVPPVLAPSDVVERFQARVERDFGRRWRVADYARALGVTPGHLNALCRARLRRSAGACIRARVVLEARRLLLYSDTPAAQIAERLGFADPAYFARFVRRETGTPPSRLRSVGRRSRR